VNAYRRFGDARAACHSFQAVRSGLLCPTLHASPNEAQALAQFSAWACSGAELAAAHRHSRLCARAPVPAGASKPTEGQLI
jgi:hypothetical protein